MIAVNRSTNKVKLVTEQLVTCAARDFHHCDFRHLSRDDGFPYLMTTRVVQPLRPIEHNVSVFVNDGKLDGKVDVQNYWYSDVDGR